MAISNKELLEKATLVSTSGTDFGGEGQAPLSVEQVRDFIKLMAAEQVFLPDVRTVTSPAATWEESIVDFGERITHGGTQATRLEAEQRAKPSTGNVTITTTLLRAEVPVSDEVFEDNVAGEGFANDLEVLIADRFGFDVEELLVNGDTESEDAYLKLNDGWLKLAEGEAGNVVEAAGDGQDYQNIFKKLLQSIPDRFKRGLQQNGRYYVPIRLYESYIDQLADRGTSLGDFTLENQKDLRYQGILLKPAAVIPIVAGEEGAADTSKILLAQRQNLYAGYQRRMRMETFRDPREGATSFVVTARVDSEIAVPEATAIATEVDVSI